jgi:hypothetical protein
LDNLIRNEEEEKVKECEHDRKQRETLS